MTAPPENKPRRTFTPEFKLNIVKLAKAQEASVAGLARKHNLNANQVFRWCHEVDKGEVRWVRLAMLGSTTLSLSPSTDTPSTFLPVKLDTRTGKQESAAPIVTIDMASGHRVQLHQGDADLLRTVLAALS